MRNLARTLARRECSGCGRTLGVLVWPWSGRLFVVTHGLCDRCYSKLERSAEEQHRASLPLAPTP